MIDEVMVKEAQDLKNEVDIPNFAGEECSQLLLCRRLKFGQITAVDGHRNSSGTFLRSQSRALEQRWQKKTCSYKIVL